MVVLWVLNGGVDGGSWAERETIARRLWNRCSREHFARRVSHAAGGAGTRVGLALEGAAES